MLKKGISVILAFVIVLSVFSLTATISFADSKEGWFAENNKTYYYVDGEKITNELYTIDGKKYYFGKDGAMYVNRLISVNSKKYYMGSDGAAYTKKLFSVEGKKYYFGSDGIAYTKRLISVDGKKYYMGSDGIAYTKRLISVDGKKYYMGSDGAAYTKRLISVDGKKYYMGSDGVAYTKRLISVDNKKYYMGSDGVAYKSRLISLNGKKYYLGSDCIAYRGRWASIDSKRYFFGSDCVAFKNKFAEINGKTYYFGSDCILYEKKLATIDGKIYYFGVDKEGAISTEGKPPYDVINTAMEEASKAGYFWQRTGKLDNLNVPSKDALNKIINGVSEGSTVDSVIGSYLGIGSQSLTISPGQNPKNKDGTDTYYHWEQYKIIPSMLTSYDLRNLQISGNNYSFVINPCVNPTFASSGFSRFTNDYVTTDLMNNEIKQNISGISVNEMSSTYGPTYVDMTIKDGRITYLHYDYSANINPLSLKALVLNIKATADYTVSATYSNFNYGYGTNYAGVMYKNKLISVDGKKYYLGKDGVAYKSRLISLNGNKYYLGKDCIAYKSKFASLDGKKYYFGSDCVMYKSKTFSVSGVKWKADSNGVCKKA